MSDFEKEKWAPSTESLARLRNTAVFYFAGGLALALLRFFGRFRIVGFVAGGMICAAGVGWLLANNPANKKTGALITGIGVLVLLSGIRINLLMIVTQTLLSIITIGFLTMGVRYLIQYFMAQRKQM